MSKVFGSLVLGGVLALGTTMPSQAASKPELQTNWVRANGASLRYKLEGKGGSTIVLLHESGMALETWDYIAPELAKNHRVLRYDLRGFGLSQAIRGPFSINDEVNDLAELLKVLNITGKVNVVGVAIGGAVALKFAADRPDLTASVIAISPAAYLQGRATGGGGGGSGAGAGGGGAPGAGPGGPRGFGGAPGGAGGPGGPGAGAPGGAPGGGASAPGQDVNEGAYPTRFRNEDPARYDRFKAIEGSAASAGSNPTMGAIYAVKYAEVLPTIKVPAVVAATSLWIRSPSEYKALADAIPNGKFEVLETGHFATMASPQMVTDLIKKYIK